MAQSVLTGEHATTPLPHLQASPIPPATVVKVRAAELASDAAGVMANLAARFESIESSALVPKLLGMLDPDEDDLPDIYDNCPHVANPDQADVNGNESQPEDDLTDAPRPLTSRDQPS